MAEISIWKRRFSAQRVGFGHDRVQASRGLPAGIVHSGRYDALDRVAHRHFG